MVCVSKKGEWKKRKEKKEIDKAQQNREGRLNVSSPCFLEIGHGDTRVDRVHSDRIGRQI
jgi:hypothetical protein